MYALLWDGWIFLKEKNARAVSPRVLGLMFPPCRSATYSYSAAKAQSVFLTYEAARDNIRDGAVGHGVTRVQQFVQQVPAGEMRTQVAVP